MADDFFAMRGEPADINEDTFLASVGRAGGSLSDCLYCDETLTSTYSPRKYVIRNANFSNFSLSKTIVQDIEFADCTFIDCRFVGTIFRKCRFTNCSFKRCNTYRMELEDVYVDPRAFSDSIPRRNYSNIGLSLYHELLQNSRSQSQPDFTDEAHFQFRKWQRRQLFEEVKEEGLTGASLKKCLVALVLLASELCVGSGVKLSVLARTFFLILVAIACINWNFRLEFGLGITSWPEALYFSVVTVTTLGFGDITPGTELGKLIVSVQAMIGLVLFATMASMIYRRIST